MPASVSTIIPTFNRADFLAEAIQSVLQQTRPAEEIIVIDDGSTDNTEQVVARHGGSLRYVWQNNSGPAAARNRGLREARGDYIAFLDSDDLWVPHKLESQLTFFSRNPEVDFVFANMANFSGTKAVNAPEIKNRKLHAYLATNAAWLEDLFACLVVENVIPTPTVMCKRSAVEKVGFFDEKLRVAEDLDYWLRSTEMCRWGFIDDVLLLRRRHGANLIADINQRNLALLSVLSKAAQRPTAQSPRLQKLIAKKIDEIRYDLGSAFLRCRDYSGARAHLSQIRASGLRKTGALLKRGVATLLEALEFGRP